MDFQKLLNSTEYDFNRRYETGEQGGIKLYIDDSDNPEFDTEIFVDADYKHFPLRTTRICGEQCGRWYVIMIR